MGILLTWIGILLAVWARYSLGRCRLTMNTLKMKSRSFNTSALAYFRTVVYFLGVILAMTGTALMVGRFRCIVGIACVLVAFLLRVISDEGLLGAQFWTAYRAYRNRTGFLIPRLW